METTRSLDFDEIKQYDKFSYVKIKIKPFWDYVGNRTEFMKLNRKEKERILLRWKYGSLDHNSNEACDHTDNYLCHRIKTFGMDGFSEGEKAFWTEQIAFHDRCLALKREVGIWQGQERNSEVDKIVKEVVNKVDWTD